MKQMVTLIIITFTAMLFVGCATGGGNYTPEVEKQKIFKPVYSKTGESKIEYSNKVVELGKKLTLKVDRQKNSIKLHYFKNSINDYNIIKNEDGTVYKFPIMEKCDFTTNIQLLNSKISKRKPVEVDFFCLKENIKVDKRMKISFDKELKTFNVEIADKNDEIKYNKINLVEQKDKDKQNKNVSVFVSNSSVEFTVIDDVLTLNKLKIKELE